MPGSWDASALHALFLDDQHPTGVTASLTPCVPFETVDYPVMSENPDSYSMPPVPEVDQRGGDELPSYEDLAAQNGPNSRYGCHTYTHGCIPTAL